MVGLSRCLIIKEHAREDILKSSPEIAFDHENINYGIF